MFFCIALHHFSSKIFLSVTCEIPALQAWQLNCVGTCDDNSNCAEEQKQGNDRNHCSQIDQGNNNTLDNNLDLLKPEASNNVVSSSDAMCFIIISCVIMVL